MKMIGRCIVVVAAAAMSGGAAFSGAPSRPGRRPSIKGASSPEFCSTASCREIIDLLTKATVGAAAASFVGIGSAGALDMDSFEKNLIEKDTAQCDSRLDPKCVPKLTPDEALCKYGVSGAEARTAACRRVRDAGGELPTSRPGERKTQGWLNGDIALTAN